MSIGVEAARGVATRTVARPAGSRTIDQLLAEARSRLDRVHPGQAYRAQGAGALVIDIRPRDQRVIEQVIPGSVPIERNHLEWRLDPASDARLPITRYDLDVVVVCAEGYTSSLAAAALQDLGLSRATDLIGGVAAWREAGLPIIADWANHPAVDPRLTVASVNGTS